MYGFNIIQSGKGLNGTSNVIKDEDIICESHMINKFNNDKVFFQNEAYIIILDGVVFNKNQLIKEGENWIQTLVSLYERNGESFFKQLIGSFVGAVYDKRQSKWIVFTDQLGTKFIYYALVDGVFICSQMMDSMYHLLRINNIDYKLDETGAFMLLSYGFMLEDYTLCKEIKKIQPGQYIVLENNQITHHTYFKLDNTEDNELTEELIIETIEDLFTQAVKRQFEKDNEYGYHHIVALSGGLDCRMTSFVGHECGYTKQLNCCFSQTNYLDETVSKAIAAFLKHEWIFKSLDNGLYLYDVDETNKLTGGNVQYDSLAHGRSLIRYINFDRLGLAHTGQLGDVIVSTHCNKGDFYQFGDGANSRNVCSCYNFSMQQDNLDKEIGLFYYRYLNGTNNGIQYLYDLTESYSPFMDLDFIRFALTIPKKYRKNHYIYKRWIIKYHPNAARFIWESTGSKINSFHVKIKGTPYPVKKILRRGLQQLHILAPDGNSTHSMNPVEYYLNSNSDLKNYLTSYYNYISYVSNKSIRDLILNTKNRGTATEQLQAITLLSAIKLYFIN